MSGVSVISRGTYVVSGKSLSGPTSCQEIRLRWKIGPSAKPSAGSVKAAAAATPARWTEPTMNRRRVTVSPSKLPGIRRSSVYGDFAWRRSATDAPLAARIEPGAEPYRQQSYARHEGADAAPATAQALLRAPRAAARSAAAAPESPARARALAAS